MNLDRAFWIAGLLSFSMCAANITTGCTLIVSSQEKRVDDLTERIHRVEQSKVDAPLLAPVLDKLSTRLDALEKGKAD